MGIRRRPRGWAHTAEWTQGSMLCPQGGLPQSTELPGKGRVGQDAMKDSEAGLADSQA